MTDDQIAQLRHLLQQSNVESKSKELDEKILDASRSLSPQKVPAERRWLADGLAFNALQTTFAIAVTIGLFLLMSRWVTVDVERQNTASQSATLQFESGLESEKDSTETNTVTAKPTLPDALPRPRTAQSAQDQILIDYTLPSVDDIVARLNREAGPVQTQHKQALVAALSDIRVRISTGDLEDARERYALLRQQCVDCNLPDTLEALVLLESQGLPPPQADTG